MAKRNIKWPAWVWYENEAAKLNTLEPLYETFGPRGTNPVAWHVLKAASLWVSPRLESWMFLPEMWRAMTPAQRRRAWRLAMEMLGYTEVCDA